jgi:hypothetical protein
MRGAHLGFWDRIGDGGSNRSPSGGVLWECAGTIVPVGVNTIDAVEQPYGVFDQPDWYPGSSGGHHEALRST